MSRSEELHRKAKVLMPAGVSSPVRAFEPYPRFMESAKGSRIRDADGRVYIDYCMGFGPLILGHAPANVVAVVKRAAEAGSVYGAPSEREVQLAEKVNSHYPAAEMMRFVNSGTEATMHAIRLARGFTGRRKIIKIEGGYHGAHDSVLVKAGSGALTHGTPSSLGVLEDLAKHTVLVPFNDQDALREALTTYKGDIAAMIIEPVPANVGPMLPADGYLQAVREETQAEDVLLIFDEVITGFRLGLGGAQARYRVRPDLLTLGKIVGGGYPIGVFAGRRDIMEKLSPLGGVYQAGTFSGNPVSVSAGLETVSTMEKDGYGGIDSRTAKLVRGLDDLFSRAGVPHRVSSIGSMFQVFLTDREIRDWSDAQASDTAMFMRLFQRLLGEGIYLPASQFETNFLSTAHGDADIEATLMAYERALRGLKG